MNKIIENSDLNSVRWNALCYGISSIYKYKNGISSMQFYMPISLLCNAVANEAQYIDNYENDEETTLGL